MDNVGSLNSSKHFYRQGKYDLAIEELQTVQQAEDNSIKARVLLLIGKCYFHKTRRVEMSSRICYMHISPTHPPLLCSENGMFKEVRMVDTALRFFDAALEVEQTNQGYYWKGRALKCKNEIDKAYTCLVQALELKWCSKYLKACAHLFDKYLYLPFSLTVDMSMHVGHWEEYSDSQSAFLRALACQEIHAIHNRSQKMMESVARLMGKKLFCCRVPFTGDRDRRIRAMTRELFDEM